MPKKPYTEMTEYHQYIDSCVLMDNPKEVFEEFSHIFLSGYIAGEMDNLRKNGKTDEVRFQARRACRYIDDNEDKITYIINEMPCNNIPDHWDKNNMDNRIISVLIDLYAKDNSFIAYSNDILFRQKCKDLGIPYSKFGNEKVEFDYKGYKEVTLSDFELASFYESPFNRFDVITNQYLIIKNKDGLVVDKQRWDGEKFSPLTNKKEKIDFTFTEKIKPRNVQQELAFDLFSNRDIKIKAIFGRHGSGKDLIMATHALSLIKQGVYDKLIFVRNNYEVAGSKPIGYLPGSQEDKLLPYAMPLADHVGGVDGLIKLIDDGVIVLQHLGFTRGRDIKKSLIYCTEAENMTKEHIQLLIGRLAEGSALWLNGDFKQIDDKIFETNNGLKKAINSLKGQELFGCIELNVTERSKTAQLADLLD